MSSATVALQAPSVTLVPIPNSDTLARLELNIPADPAKYGAGTHYLAVTVLAPNPKRPGKHLEACRLGAHYFWTPGGMPMFLPLQPITVMVTCPACGLENSYPVTAFKGYPRDDTPLSPFRCKTKEPCGRRVLTRTIDANRGRLTFPIGAGKSSSFTASEAVLAILRVAA